jgi:hypothetical protein
MTPLQEKCFNLTKTFETSYKNPTEGFSVIAGNFDGQGISFGVLQWNLGQGTLQPMLHSLLISNRADMVAIFGAKAIELEQMLQKPRKEQIQWGDSISAYKRYGRKSIIEPWYSMFKKMGELPACQAAQKKMCESYFKWADSRMKIYKLSTERGYALLFDIAVQNGGIKDAAYRSILSEYSKIPYAELAEEAIEIEVRYLEIIAKAVSKQSRIDHTAKDPEWIQKDVLSRKLCIARGSGIVHGVSVNLSEYNLELTPVA